MAIPLGLFLLNFWSLEIGLPFIIFYSLVFGYSLSFCIEKTQKTHFLVAAGYNMLLSAIFWDINEPDASLDQQGGYFSRY